MTTTPSIQNPTDWSDYDFLAFVSFVWKVEREGFTYAAENYGPKFETPALQAAANDLRALRTLFREHGSKVDAWSEAVGGKQACDLHNDHVDEERKREVDACLFGVRCTDGFVIHYATEEYRDQQVAYLQANAGKGYRIPVAVLSRTEAGGIWTQVQPIEEELARLAVAGRRVMFAYHRDRGTYLPGIVTDVITGPNGGPVLLIRLDGQRRPHHVPADYEFVRYLEEVVPVPALPMGRFTPTASDLGGEVHGVLVCSVGEDGETLIFLTGDKSQAESAAKVYVPELGLDKEYVNLQGLQTAWAVFDWEPADAESEWTVRWDATEADDQAIRIHYLTV